MLESCYTDLPKWCHHAGDCGSVDSIDGCNWTTSLGKSIYQYTESERGARTQQD